MAGVLNISRIRNLSRFGRISRVLAKHGFGGVLDLLLGRHHKTGESRRLSASSIHRGALSAERFRRALEELGPSFIKLGQLMSTRPDVLPPAYIEELRKLQDRVPPVPFEAIQTVIESELGQPLDKIFYRFSKAASAAASVAQVHEAELFTGEKVAVKVIRPGITKTIREDIQLMYALAERIEKSFEIGSIIGVTNVVKEFERTIFRELDLLIEAGSMEKFSANFQKVDEIHIPAVFWELSTRSVLVMEYIPGVKVDDVDRIRQMGIDPEQIAMIGLRSFSRQLFKHGFFHADPHPANTIVMPDGRVGLVDFGITGYLDEELMRHLAFLFLGYAEHDYTMVITALVDAGIVDEYRIDLRDFRDDLKDISEPFYGRSLKTITVRDVADQVMVLIYKYRIRLPRNLLLLLKTLIQTEALGKLLGSEASLLQVTRPYARRMLARGHEARHIMRHLGDEIRSASGHMRNMPKLVHDILRNTAKGRQRIEIEHTGFDQVDTRMEKGLNRFIVGIIISASTIAGSLVLNAGHDIASFSIHAFGIDRISLTGLLGVTGYTIATILGIWLIISIFRSGKM